MVKTEKNNCVAQFAPCVYSPSHALFSPRFLVVVGGYKLSNKKRKENKTRQVTRCDIKKRNEKKLHLFAPFEHPFPYANNMQHKFTGKKKKTPTPSS